MNRKVLMYILWTPKDTQKIAFANHYHRSFLFFEFLQTKGKFSKKSSIADASAPPQVQIAIAIA